MNHFSWLGHYLHLPESWVHALHLGGYDHVLHAIFIGLILVFLGLIANRQLRSSERVTQPSGKMGVTSIFEVACESLLSLMEGIIGHDAKKYFPLVASIFIFIFVNNLTGILPGFQPATGNINTTLALGLVTFFYFNYVGIKEQGLGSYLKHFCGPILLLAPVLFIIEILGVLVRPVSLGLRLYGNMTGDHLVLGIFSGLVPIGVPIAFLALGIFVSFIQAFVFSLLTTIYIALALPHHEEEHHH